MPVPSTPMRWPNNWNNPAALTLLQGTPIDCLLIDAASPVRQQAGRQGLHLATPDALPAGVSLLKGEWPGVKTARGRGAADTSAAGPTGVPWVDSNGWNIRLHAALHPQNSLWVDAPPPADVRLSPGSYLTAIADSAAHGGRWILSLDPELAAGIASQNAAALATWKSIAASAAFFASRREWQSYTPISIVGVVSSFTGKNEFFSQELLNLLARAGQHYLVLPTSGRHQFASLRAVVYPDTDPPSAALRQQLLAFVKDGGLLIASPQWGAVPSPPLKDDDGRYMIHTMGKGRIAQAKTDPDDPYLWAQDSALLVSHRYDLVRFWNGGATASFYTQSPDRKHALVHLLFYANRGPDSASIRIAGRFRAARAFTVEQQPLPGVEVLPQKDAVEVHLPQVPQYVALELDA